MGSIVYIIVRYRRGKVSGERKRGKKVDVGFELTLGSMRYNFHQAMVAK